MVAVTKVEPLDGYRVRLWFDDNTERVVGLSDQLWGTMGEPLRDAGFFRRVRVDAETPHDRLAERLRLRS
jgi:hypothetical protein